jgi:hypothetical protein
MPHIDPESSFGALLERRDFKTQITPTETQRTTLIVAGCYIIAIAILWYAQEFLGDDVWN